MLEEGGRVLPAQVVAVLVVQRLECEPAETAVEHAILSLRLTELVHQEVDGVEAGVGGWERQNFCLLFFCFLFCFT